MRALMVAALGSFALMGCQSRSSEREPIERATVALHEGEAVLDTRVDGATLVMRELPGEPQSDGPRRLSVRMVARGESRELGTLADARFAERALLVLGLDGVLARLGDDGSRRELDHAAHAPLSVRGGKVAYARGEPPVVELALAEVDSAGNAPIALAPEWTPAWCPVLAEDGSVVFVTGHSGAPQLARARIGELPRVIVEAPEAFPEGPDTPLLVGDRLSFQFRGVKATISLGAAR